jgi:hypothetical protein
MFGFVEMALSAEKDDAMAQKSIADRGHRCNGQIAPPPHTTDFRTNRRRDQLHIQGSIGRA